MESQRLGETSTRVEEYVECSPIFCLQEILEQSLDSESTEDYQEGDSFVMCLRLCGQQAESKTQRLKFRRLKHRKIPATPLWRQENGSSRTLNDVWV